MTSQRDLAEPLLRIRCGCAVARRYDLHMTTREQLHRLVDELTDAEAEDALRVMVARREDEVSPRIVLSDDEAQRFLDALEQPSSFEPGLRRLAERPRVLGA
jgi:hypothetical protein